MKTVNFTTVSVDHMLPQIDLGIEHGLIGVENRSHFRMTRAPKVGSDFRLRKIGAGVCMIVPSIKRTARHTVGDDYVHGGARECTPLSISMG